MDKYDRQAAEIVFKHFGAKADYSLAAVIAAALRESAAEAFEEVAEGFNDAYKKSSGLSRADRGLIAQLINVFESRAAVLRSTTREKP